MMALESKLKQADSKQASEMVKIKDEALKVGGY
jgi:hypothetical protein